MPSQAELDAAFKSVRVLVDARAGWYAQLISDDMLRDAAHDALVAAEQARIAQSQKGESR